jgi:hypothetical protein
LSNFQLKAIWHQGKTLVIFRRNNPFPVLVRVPFTDVNKEWLRNDRCAKPKGNDQFKAWEIPTALFD